MLLIPCPWCGERHETEFTYGGDASRTMPAGKQRDSLDAWYTFVYERRNPAGLHLEYWHHSYGCGKWFTVQRNTLDNEISYSAPAHPAKGGAT